MKRNLAMLCNMSNTTHRH